MSSGIFNLYTGYHNRRSNRLCGYDYSQPGSYFITICVHDRTENMFGNVVNGATVLNEVGEYAKKAWLDMPEHYPDVKLDEFMVMPNHLHGIIRICNLVGVQHVEPLQKREPRLNQYQHVIPHSIGTIVRGMKSAVTKWFRQKYPGTILWQRDYYDHVIRDENSLYYIRKYIRNNPLSWMEDSENHIDHEIEEFKIKRNA